MNEHINPIKKWRVLNDLTQAEAAEQARVSQQEWSKFEKDLSKPRGDDLKNILKLTGLTAEQVLGLAA
jgi:transcriptional regulator with XRE-family HTH domain